MAVAAKGEKRPWAAGILELTRKAVEGASTADGARRAVDRAIALLEKRERTLRGGKELRPVPGKSHRYEPSETTKPEGPAAAPFDPTTHQRRTDTTAQTAGGLPVRRDRTRFKKKEVRRKPDTQYGRRQGEVSEGAQGKRLTDDQKRLKTVNIHLAQMRNEYDDLGGLDEHGQLLDEFEVLDEEGFTKAPAAVRQQYEKLLYEQAELQNKVGKRFEKKAQESGPDAIRRTIGDLETLRAQLQSRPNTLERRIAEHRRRGTELRSNLGERQERLSQIDGAPCASARS
jgi:hypothetical protein